MGILSRMGTLPSKGRVHFESLEEEVLDEELVDGDADGLELESFLPPLFPSLLLSPLEDDEPEESADFPGGFVFEPFA